MTGPFSKGPFFIAQTKRVANTIVYSDGVIYGDAGATTNKTMVTLSIHNSNNDLLWKYRRY